MNQTVSKQTLTSLSEHVLTLSPKERMKITRKAQGSGFVWQGENIKYDDLVSMMPW